MISVETALNAVLDLVNPGPTEHVPLRSAAGRVLAQPVHAARSQPPFPASAMDGYAVYDGPGPWRVIGESAAGHGFSGTLEHGQAVRIFTGAPVPTGATRVVIQEDVTRDGDIVHLGADPDTNLYIRAEGSDFKRGATFHPKRPLRPQDIAQLAAMNIAQVPVVKAPKFALISTGDELVMPGEDPSPDQIIASNTFGLAALLERAGCEVQILPIARDTIGSLQSALYFVRAADVIVTIGGASVGDHDLVGQVAKDLGLDQTFYKVAMRPGKPLMAGRMGKQAMVGLPGNPVSAMVCAEVFLRPMVDRMLHLDAGPRQTLFAPLAHDIGPNGPREHYMRASVDTDITVYGRQDSALLSVLTAANALAVRPPHDPARKAGFAMPYIPL